MDKISEEIIKILKKNNVKVEEYSSTLKNIVDDINNSLWIDVTLSSSLFYSFKDVVFFNFEYTEKKGITKLTDLGTKYPTLMYSNFNNSYFYDELKTLYEELKSIRDIWNENIKFAELYSKTDFNWIVDGENSTRLIVFDGDKEKPQDYGYNNSTYSNILDVNNKRIKYDNDTILCKYSKMNQYNLYPSLTNILTTLIQKIELALEQNKGIHIEFEDYQGGVGIEYN